MRQYLFFLFLIFITGLACAQTEVILSNSFAEELATRSTLVSRMKVLKITPEYGVQDDGDLHVYGQDSAIGLNTVAEVINSGMDAQMPANKLFKNAQKKNSIVRVEGVWRIWCEHGKKGIHKQGVMKDPHNLDHVFELHPVTHADSIDLTGSFTVNPEVNSYTEATKAFKHYNKLKCRLKAGNDSIHIILTKALFNYARFNINVPLKVEEGVDFISWYGHVYDSAGVKLPGDPIRIIAVKGMRSYTELLNAKNAKMITVIAEPRLNMEIIYRKLKPQLKQNEFSEHALPYEMVITAIEEK